MTLQKDALPARTTTPRGDASRRRLIAAAREELVERDGQMEIDSVAGRADSSVGLIYRHFGSRAGLIAAVVDDFYSRFRTEALQVDPMPNGSFTARERRRVELAVAFHYADPLSRVVVTHLHLDGQVAVAEAAQVENLVSDVADVVTTAQRRGEVGRDRDARSVGAMIVGGTRQVLAGALAADPRPAEKKTSKGVWTLVAGVLGVDPDGV
jgi:AcrR family transcriptional regulator